FGVVVEELEGFALGGADDRVAADADAGGLADASARVLVDGFVDEGAAARDDTDAAHREDVAGHDSDAALARRDNARAVRADEPRRAALERALHDHHVLRRNAFGDADDERD